MPKTGRKGPDYYTTSKEEAAAGRPSWDKRGEGGEGGSSDSGHFAQGFRDSLSGKSSFVNGDSGGGGRLMQDGVHEREERFTNKNGGAAANGYSKDTRKGWSGRKGGGGKWSNYRELENPHSLNNTETDDGSDPGAVMYIIVVLVFYSTGVMVMIVRYLRTEKKELEEEVTLENFFKSMPDKRAEQEHRVNTVAIRAFHTLTSISYDDEELEGMNLGSDDDEDDEDDEEDDDEDDVTSRDRKSLDATSSQPLLVTDL
ncbi:uncharacterized protein [Littorina saxatilis]|uniref:uncharacterized protein n=1 Tax=Littorina saxatilis TaxID=31220 RepID=UPI0038B4DB85